MYKYTIEAYEVSAYIGNYNTTEIIVYSDSEKTAIEKAKKLIKRKCYTVRKIEES